MEQFFRPRRLRRTPIIRSLVAEHSLHTGGLIQPYFVCDGTGIRDYVFVGDVAQAHLLALDRLAGQHVSPEERAFRIQEDS